MISSLLKLIYAVLLTYLFVKFLKWLLNYLYQLNNYKNLKGLPILPLLGNTHQLGLKNEFLKRLVFMSKTFKNEPVFRFWRGWNPVVIFHKADHLDLMMSGSKNNQKSFEYDFLRPWLADGLLTSHGDKWNFRRRLLTPTFHFDILNDFLHVFNEQSDVLIEVLTRLSKLENHIDIYKRLGYCALDIICETAMGKHASTQIDGSNSTYYKAVAKMVVVVRERTFTPWLWPDIIYNNFTNSGKEHREALKILHGFTEKIIMERNEEFIASNFIFSDKRVAFLDMLLKAKHEDPSITFTDIQEEVDTFMFEGHDTTAAAMSFACHLIGSNPDVQNKLQIEVDQVIGSVNRQITNEDLKNLKYLECVIKETLRLFPSVPLHGRVFSQTDQIGDQKILAGTTGAIFTYMIHRDEKYYPDPEKFDPDRFLLENCKDRHPFAYIPFSAGRRNCIGQRFAIMEEKVVLCKILRKFEIKACLTTEQLEPIADVILRPMNEIPIRLSLRNKFYF